MKAVLFDMDGVVVNSEEEFLNQTMEFLTRQGVHASIPDVVKVVGKDEIGAAEYLVKNFGLSMDAETCIAEMRVMYGNTAYHSPRVVLIEGVVEFISFVRSKNLKTALVSASLSRDMLTVLNRFGLHSMFDAVVGVDMVEKAKPAPDGYLQAMKWLDVTPEDCLVIEDSTTGIRAGLASGARVVGFQALGMGIDVSAAHETASSYAELKKRLEPMLAQP